MSNFELVGEVSEEEGSIEKLCDVFDDNRREFLEDFTSNEVVVRGSFEKKVLDDCLNIGFFESVGGREFELLKGFQKTDEGFLLIR
jgi:hypothetical protein